MSAPFGGIAARPGNESVDRLTADAFHQSPPDHDLDRLLADWRRRQADNQALIFADPLDTIDLPDDFDDEIITATARAGEMWAQAVDWHDVPDLVDPLSRAEQALLGLLTAAGLGFLAWLGLRIAGFA